MSGRSGLRFVVTLVLLLGALAPAMAGASEGARAGDMGGDLRLSGPNAVGDEWWPAVAYSGTSGVFLMVREDERDPFWRGSDIFGRRVGADGRAIGPDFRISGKGAYKHDRSPAVAWNQTANEFLVVWADYRQEDKYGSEIWGQRVKADGTLVAANFRISSGSSDQLSPSVAWNQDGGEYLVVWEDNRNTGFHGSDVYGRRVAADGTTIEAADFLISRHEALGYDQHSEEKFPDVAWNSVVHDYLVVWQDTEEGSGRGWEIYGRMVTGGGALDGDEFRICGAAATSHEQWPAVAYGKGSGTYLVVWMDFRDSADRGADIFARRVASGGYPTGKEVRLSGPSATGDEAVPDVAWGATTKQYLVVWDDTRDSVEESSDTWGQLVDGAGEKVGSNFRISGSQAEGTEWSPAVAWGSGINKFLVARGDARDAATAKKVDIFGRVVLG